MEAGRDVAAGRSPYAPDLVSGAAPLATSLFYSYPPPVAQAFSLLAADALTGGLRPVVDRGGRRAPRCGGAAPPSPGAASVTRRGAVGRGGLRAVDAAVRRRPAVREPRRLVPAPLWSDAAGGHRPGARHSGGWRRRPGVRSRETAPGVPGPVVPDPGVPRWPRGRALGRRPGGGDRGRGGASLVVGASIVLGGTTVWSEYADVVRAGARATIVDPRNAGHRGADRVSWSGPTTRFARSLHLVVAAAALLVTVWAAWRRPDPVESFAWAAAASLATLPVTWYHYPSAMLPIAVAAMLRASGPDTRRVSLLVAAGAVVAAISLVWLPLLWVAVGLIVAAARASAPAPAPASDPAGVPAPATG